MKRKRLIDWPYVIGLMLLPVAIVAILHLVKEIQEIARYDPVYFSETYLVRYKTPGSVAIDLEQALRSGDRALMSELLGTQRGPGELKPLPQLIFVFLLGEEGGYYQYLYFNAADYNRHIQYVKKQQGRYIASEDDLYYYMDSGRWTEVAAPLAATWWSLVIVFTAGVYIYRRMRLARQRMYAR